MKYHWFFLPPYRHKVVNPCVLLGLGSHMEEEQEETLLGSHPVYLAPEGYDRLAEALINMAEHPEAVYGSSKRVREEEEEGEEYPVLRARTEEWVYREAVLRIFLRFLKKNLNQNVLLSFRY